MPAATKWALHLLDQPSVSRKIDIVEVLLFNRTLFVATILAIDDDGGDGEP